MAQCRLAVHFAGPMVSWQDAGRPGLMRYGVPGSGPMDHRTLAVANAALGNPPGACGIEVSLGGLVVDCVAGAVSFAVAGGGFQVRLGDQALGPWTVATLRQGQRLAIRPGDWGSWAALAFAGVLEGTVWLGSLATHAPSGLGGGLVRSADTLLVTGAEERPAREGDLTLPGWAQAQGRTRVVIGPQERFFDAASLVDFQTAPFTLTAACDRMGVRLAQS
jgi:allophanate hydrolase subunit 2